MADKQVRAQYTQEFKREAVRQVRTGDAIVVATKVPGQYLRQSGQLLRVV